MERIIRTQQYLYEALKNSLTGDQTRKNDVGYTLAQITGNYCHSDLENAIIGYGLHFDGYIHVSLDESLICHNHACIGWMEKLAKQFNISSNSISIIRTARPRSLFSNDTGVAVGHESIVAKQSFGTIGGFIYPKFAGDSYRIISNNHVLGATNKGVKGDAICAITNTPYKIGVLENMVTLFGNGIPNHLDLAVAKLEGYEPSQYPTLALPKHVLKNEQVSKFGAKTGYTVGKVVSNSYKTVIDYNGENALFENQLMIVSNVPGNKFSDGGDSGSMIKSANGEFVGLLFAGNNLQTFANPSQTVLDKLTEWRYI